MADRDLSRIVFWLEDHVSLAFADKFESRFNDLIISLSAWPRQWQRVQVAGRTFRRAVLLKGWVVLYQVQPEQKLVLISAVRGAAEDWMNTPVSE